MPCASSASTSTPIPNRNCARWNGCTTAATCTSACSGKPTQYITRHQEFYGRDFRVTPDVLIPRPETEHVVEVALDVARGARRILDIGTGSGALAVTLRLELAAETWATDISPAAAAV